MSAYSQYSYSQYQTQSQQLQQQNAASATPSMTWNGVQWVAAVPSAAVATVGGGAPPAPQAPPGHTIPPPTSTPTAFVTAYSLFYQEWKNQSQQQAQLAATLPPGERQEEARRRAQWAEYYADQSSRAAHYYQSQPQEQPQLQQQYQQQQQYSQPQQYPSQTQQQGFRQTSVEPARGLIPAPGAASGAVPTPPDAMKRFVHRCLAQARSENEKKQIQAAVEAVIGAKIREGALQTTDWDRLESVNIPGRSISQPHQFERMEVNGVSQKTPRSDITSQYVSQYGSRGGRDVYDAPFSDGSDRYTDRSVNANSYYGPSVGDATFGKTQDDFVELPKRQKKRKRKTGMQANRDLEDNGFARSNDTLLARASRFSGSGGIEDAAHSSNQSELGNIDRYSGRAVIGGTRKLDETDYENMTVKGTSVVLEKGYLRLTAPPRPELVRPESILRQHLINLKQLWILPEDQRKPKRDYEWFCSQFKALRQDLTVQRIFNPLTIDVYETHARIALEQGDINEFNQCQTQLKELYVDLSNPVRKQTKQQSGKEKGARSVGLENEMEFIAYRILYYIFLTTNKKYQGGSSDLLKILLSLSAKQRDDPAVVHALKVRVAVAEFDYHTFFRLQGDCPNLGAYLMDYLIPWVRQNALQRIHKAFRPSVDVTFVLSKLGYDRSDAEEMNEGRAWLVSCGCKLSNDGVSFLTKDSVLKESDILDKKSSLI